MPIFELRRPIVADFETYWDTDCSVKANKRGWVGGNYHYVNHPKFYPYMVSFYDLETHEKGVIDDRAKFQNFVDSIRGRTIVAANAGFDTAVAWSIDHTFQSFNTFDVGDMSQYLQCPRNLEGAVQHLLGKSMDKTMREVMSGKHYADIGVENQRRMRDYALRDAVMEAELFLQHRHRWPELEQWLSDFTRRQNWAGMRIDQEYLQTQTDRVSSTRSKAMLQIPWVEDAGDKPLSAKKLALWCRETGIEAPTSLAEDSEECQAWENKYGGQYPVVAAMRDFRKSNTYAKKLGLIERLLRPDGTIPLATKYAAAPHTLRFSATQYNYQSLPRAADFCDLRGCTIPDEGHLFIGSDLAGIEARCLPWLAGDYDYLNQVRTLDKAAAATDQTGGGDIYEPAARRLFGYTDPRPLKKVDKDLRFATKTCVLQLGYQSGRRKFHRYISNNVEPKVLDRVRAGKESDEDLAGRLVSLYRGVNPKIQELWYSLDRDLRSCCHAGVPFTVQLPNGGTVTYSNLMVRDSVDVEGRARVEVVGSVCAGHELKKLYGGKITENICQRMARDVLCSAVYNIETAGLPVKFEVHDEIVVQVKREDANRDTAREIEKIMSHTPAWAEGLPLAAETSILERYAK